MQVIDPIHFLMSKLYEKRFALCASPFMRWSFVLSLALVTLTVESILRVEAATFSDATFLIDSWETEQGLPENSATAMVQTPDGYLWFGSPRV